ncbi:uncharacterized protein EV420DRAFT_1645335 [Desarmillaria tabescens]|uniref:Uncharacterized protein n=1 Tax=Armillaria tabescens TaxID=1929756 RepID=A0AA39K686_ARMTA|nr:uncharacterized protein EV420DRAFT_1645335 [Desarmillaria tabescens]KAK0454106.1 hypothetical protein EV420DRAFT_1645335 [Desarmillaria tabescens]
MFLFLMQSPFTKPRMVRFVDVVRIEGKEAPSLKLSVSGPTINNPQQRGKTATASSSSPPSPSMEPEIWDDEFELDEPVPSTSTAPPRRTSHELSSDEDDFGLWDSEDRTLTARSSRKPSTPPPPVPPLPSSLLHSPTASLFSAPSYHANNSSTHLRPTFSRTSASTLSHLPPSPPIARRRLKKKSRPPETMGMFEMQEFSEEELPAAREKDDDPPTSPTVLARIGSVKSKWGLRRKRASATPAEVVRDERHDTSWFAHSPSVNKRKSMSGLPADMEAELNSTPTPKEGSRSWMGNVRRLSLGGKHKRGISIGTPGTSGPDIPSVELLPSPSKVASLGRTAAPSTAPVTRRNSLGDLKIPPRVAQAQVGLRRDLGLVREFAQSVDELKALQNTYQALVTKLDPLLAQPPPPPSSSPSIPVFRPRGRSKSNAKHLAAEYYGLEKKMNLHHRRPLALPIASPSPAWRASTGRHDLSQRQLHLLHEMLASPQSQQSQHPTTINREWRWGDSTITLPSQSEDSSSQAPEDDARKKRRGSRLGLGGLRDALKALKWHQHNHEHHHHDHNHDQRQSANQSKASLHSNGNDGHLYPHARLPTYGRRRAKTSTEPYESYSSLSNGHGKPASSPRRPSLASIFRIGSSKTSSSKSSSVTGGADASKSNLNLSLVPTTSSDYGWDHFDDREEHVDTIRVKNRLSNVEEEARSNRFSQPGPSTVVPPLPNGSASHPPDGHVNGSTRPPSLPPLDIKGKGVLKSGSVRSMPPTPAVAMTPENIRPLLDNAREVKRCLEECIEELRVLLRQVEAAEK